MIVAYCDHCGHAVDPDTKAGCRVLAGNKEFSFHLCSTCQEPWLEMTQEYLVANEWRSVK